MRISRRLRNRFRSRSCNRFRNREQGQSSVEYTLLVALVVLAIVGFAKGYSASIGGVTGVTASSLAAAASALPQLPASPSIGDGSGVQGVVRGWNNERPLTAHSLTDKLKRGFQPAVARSSDGAAPAAQLPKFGGGK